MKTSSPVQLQVESMNRFYSTWKNLFRCEVLEKYYEGFQWNSRLVNYQPYTLNMVYSTIKLKLANIVFQRPEFEVTPIPAFSDWNQEFAIENAYIKQDALNTVIRNPKVKFVHNTRLCALDSFFRFGIMEIGYAADWKNPLSVPFLTDENGKVVNKDEASVQLPSNERIYFKHVRASRFRVAGSDATTLDQTAVCGYYDFRYKSDLQNIKGIKLPSEFKVRYSALDYGDISSYLNVESKSPEMWALISRGEVLKVWHLWNNYEKTFGLYIDGHFDDPVYEDTFERLPFADVRWDLRAPSLENQNSTGWYPIPPVFQWISSQDEINRTREQLRNYRRRFTRKWGYVKGTVDPVELEKLKTEEDGLAIETKRPDAIFSIANPEIGISIQESLSVNMSDLNLVTGTSAEARADSDRQTATQSKIIDVRQQIRESIEQLDFSDFMIACGREALIQMKERFTEGMWIKSSADPGEDILGEIQEKKVNFKYITSQDLDDGYDEEIGLNVVNASPQKMMEEKAKFLEFLAIVNQYPQIALDPTLIREAAYRVGYRNEKVIKKMQQMAILNMMSQAATMQAKQGGGGGGVNANNQNLQTLNATPNPTNEIQSQLAAQVG